MKSSLGIPLQGVPRVSCGVTKFVSNAHLTHISPTSHPGNVCMRCVSDVGEN
jgi:hypothetical protein